MSMPELPRGSARQWDQLYSATVDKAIRSTYVWYCSLYLLICRTFLLEFLQAVYASLLFCR